MSIIAQMSPFFNVGSTPTPAPTPFVPEDLSFVRSLDVSANVAIPYGISFNSIGTIMIVVGSGNARRYNLSTAWNISTATHSNSQSISSQVLVGVNAFVTDNGENMYISDAVGNQIEWYTMSTAWDVTTLSFQSGLATGHSNLRGVFVRSNGAKMYYQAGDVTYEYDLSTAFNPATRTLVSSRTVQSGGWSLFITSDGSTLTIMHGNSTTVNQLRSYSLTTPWDITTVSSAESTLEVASGNKYATFWSPDGLNFYLTETDAGEIWQYGYNQ